MPRLVLALIAVVLTGSHAFALTPQECSARYQAAKRDGSLGDRKWNQFRKAECGTTALEPATVPNPLGAGAGEALPRTPSPEPGKPVARGNPGQAGEVFPRAVASPLPGESEGKARMRTCLDRYNANKATGGNGGMRWIEKGGGYYAACNARLKG
jgi:hypothetical protein